MAEADAQRVTLRNVRASFLHVFKPQEQKNDDGTVRLTYNANFLMEKGTEDTKKNLAALKKAADAAKRAQWGENPEKWPKIPSHKVCLRDGDNPDHVDGDKRPEYAGQFFVSCNSPEDRPPQVKTNRKGDDDKWIDARPGQKGAPYSGCYCNAVIRVWAQDNKHGKRINAALDVIQFRADGEAFSGAAPVKAEDYLSEDDVSYEGDMDGAYGDGDDDSLI
jgi:hypothetical protein